MVCGVAFIVIAITAARIRALYHDSVTVIATTCRVQNHRHTRPFQMLVATVNDNGWNNRRPSRFQVSTTTERRLFSTIAFYTSYLPHTCRIRINSYRDTRTERSLTAITQHFSPHYPLKQYNHFSFSTRKFRFFIAQQCTPAPWWTWSANFCSRNSTCRPILWERQFPPSHRYPHQPTFTPLPLPLPLPLQLPLPLLFLLLPPLLLKLLLPLPPHQPTHTHFTTHTNLTNLTQSTTHSPFNSPTSSPSTSTPIPHSPNSIPLAPLPQHTALHSIYPVIYP